MGSGSSGYTVGKGGGDTSGARDSGYKGGAATHHSIGDNLAGLTSEYPYENGLFGSKGYGRHTRHLYSDDPLADAHNFYEKGAYGGLETPMDNGKGFVTKMKDGSTLSIRDVSNSDGTPAVEIRIKHSTDSAGVKEQKIHFMKEGDER